MPNQEHPSEQLFDPPEASIRAPEPPDPGVPRLQPVNRTQLQFRVVDVEALIPEDHPARAIWEFVGRLDLSRFTEEIRAVEGGAGRPAYHPQLLVSLWIYSYSQGVTSARALERLCAHDPAYHWLTGLEGISAHTLSDVRVAHGDALREVFIQVLGVLSGGPDHAGAGHAGRDQDPRGRRLEAVPSEGADPGGAAAGAGACGGA